MTVTWKPNPSAPLWDEESSEEPAGPHFQNVELNHILQSGPTCVPTTCLLYTSPSPRDRTRSRMPSSA